MGSIWQNAPSIALESGCFDGLTPVTELRQHGNLGIGAFDQLNGEMTGVDGIFYRVFEDSKARPAEDDETLPFCMITQFLAPKAFRLPPDITEETLGAYMDDNLGTDNLFFSLRIDGVFTDVHTRCFPKQTKPYPTLADVMKNQPTFSYDRLEGTMVGFRAPSYIGHMTPPGTHLHLISADRTIGGHVMSFSGAEATLEAERIDDHEIAYPETTDFLARDLAAS
jgi:acetolactate decarboxylase